jgi:hypothetical protein
MYTYPIVVGCAEDGRVVEVMMVGVDVLLKAHTKNGQMAVSEELQSNLRPFM